MIIDPNEKDTISKQNLHSVCDYSIFEGFEVSCKIPYVLLRGKVLVKDGKFLGEKGYGKFIKRSPKK